MKNRFFNNHNINLKFTCRSLLIITLLISLFCNDAFSISGVLTDNYGKLVPFASIKFTDQSNPNLVYTGTSDGLGNYQIDAPIINQSEDTKNFILFDVYPNPASDGVVIPINLIREGNLSVYIYNTYGEKVNVVAENVYFTGLYQFVWDGRTNAHQRVAPGIYFVQVIFNGRTSCKKVVLTENRGYNVTPVSMSDLLNRLETYKIKYNITITGSTIERFYLTDYVITRPDSNDFIVQRHVPVPFKAQQGSNYLSVYDIDNNVYNKIFIKGINLGVTLPGKYPGELLQDTLLYRRWLDSIGAMGFNTIRIYTLHYPIFYQEFARYNKEHPSNPLYLLQGIWLDEDTISKLHGNFYGYAQGYDNDNKEIVDCIHGKRTIAPRFGKAYGTFKTDVSRWVIGYIQGREMSPYEVLKNDNLNSSHNTYNSPYNAITLPMNGTPTECWIAERLDLLIRYERATYLHERPVSTTSWPTLDPLHHDSEVNNYGSSEDIAQLDLEKLVMKNAPAGFFLSYHAYPYFPDFISSLAEGYWKWSDSVMPEPSKCAYYGYLKFLRAYYTYPVLIAEFGVPSSWGNAHYERIGMTHGGEDEVQQGNYDVRLLKDIYKAKCAGGCLFEWINENFKNNWVTEPTSCGIDRRIMWHNLASPEENFGLIKYEEDPPTYTKWPDVNFIIDTVIRINKIQADYDNQFFYTKVYFDQFNLTDTLLIGFDTYGSGVGEDHFDPNLVTSSNLCEFLLKITKDSTNLYVTQAYDTYSIWPGFYAIDSFQQVFQSISTSNHPWNIVKWKIDNPDTSIFYFGRLKNCNYLDTATASTNNAVVRYPDHVEIRLPWHILNFTDPSNNEVLNCVTCGNGKRPHSPPFSMISDSLPKETTYTQGIAISAFMSQKQLSLVETGRFPLIPWGIDINSGFYTPPAPLKEIEKKSMKIFKNFLLTYPFPVY